MHEVLANFGYLLDVFTLYNMAAMLLGICVGLVIGAIPGLNPPMAIALLIPLSFQMPPATALILLTSVYAAGMYGGSFSAILLRAPGTSASAATAIEGWEMTIRGKAVQAIRVSTFASVVGGVLSALVLILVAPPAAKVALLFQPAEYFLVGLLGLVSIASVSFKSLSKGLISGFIGIVMSTVGIDMKSAFPRFTFDMMALEGGLGIMPAIIGLFALAQALSIAEGDASATILKTGETHKVKWELWPKWSEIVYLRWVLIRSWIVGIVIGIIPAAGGSVAQWIAYSDAIRRAKPGDCFGQGEIKGLAACEASNNAVTGTSMIPMFILGIPGGISAAVIMGALMIHGLNPGMRLFTESAGVVYPVMWGFLVANIVMGFFSVWVARSMAYVTFFPRGLLAPLIITFSFAGQYASSGNIYDVWVMMFFGILGYVMEKFDFVPAATLLGLILGPICEAGFRDWFIVSHGNPVSYLLGRPVADALLALLAVMLWYSIQHKRRLKSRGSVAEEPA